MINKDEMSKENEIMINDLEKLNELDSKQDVISIVYDEEKLREKLGNLWRYHLEAVDKEPPEIKILFALINDCKININYRLEPVESCRFENPGLSEDVLKILSEKLGVDSDFIFEVLDAAPAGVVSVIISIIQ